MFSLGREALGTLKAPTEILAMQFFPLTKVFLKLLSLLSNEFWDLLEFWSARFAQRLTTYRTRHDENEKQNAGIVSNIETMMKLIIQKELVGWCFEGNFAVQRSALNIECNSVAECFKFLSSSFGRFSFSDSKMFNFYVFSGIML